MIKKTYYGYSFENHNISMICFDFFTKKNIMISFLWLKKTEVLFPKKT